MNFTKPSLLFFAATSAFTVLLAGTVLGAAGGLYQVNSANGSILKYSPGNGTPATFASGLLATPNKIAFNKAGELYAGEGTGTTARIVKFSPFGVKTTFATGIQATGMACDDAGNLFVSGGDTIYKITPAGVRSQFHLQAGTRFLDLMFDENGNLMAVDLGSSPIAYNGADGQGRVLRFTPNGSESVYASGLTRPTCLATDRAGSTYIGTKEGTIIEGTIDYSDPSISFGGTVVRYGFGDIQGLACDPAGNLFISTASGIARLDKQTKTKTTFSQIGGSGLALEPPRALALNIATRLQVQTGDNALFAGFIVTGSVGKKVLIRGIGPSLSAAGISGALQDPTIELRNSSGGLVNGNNNWKDTQQAAIEATGAAPADNRESALVITLGPGSWTVVLRGVGNTTGVGVVEVYDLDTIANSTLANISSRGVVQAGENVMIGGFIIGSGNGAARLAIRAIGPSLAAFGISNPLADPMVSLRDANGATIRSNDNWRETQATEIHEAHIAPSNEAESAMIVTLPSGNYTAIVSGRNGGTGVGLVEVYNIQ